MMSACRLRQIAGGACAGVEVADNEGGGGYEQCICERES